MLSLRHLCSRTDSSYHLVWVRRCFHYKFVATLRLSRHRAWPFTFRNYHLHLIGNQFCGTAWVDVTHHFLWHIKFHPETTCLEETMGAFVLGRFQRRQVADKRTVCRIDDELSICRLCDPHGDPLVVKSKEPWTRFDRVVHESRVGAWEPPQLLLLHDCRQ